MVKRVVISVTSDLSTDQRVRRAASALKDDGFEVVLVGRLLSNSLEINNLNYATKRFKLWFNKGPLFYANYNLRLFLFLLFIKADILLANDLDTLLPNYLVSVLRKKVLIYDNHEYFTGVPELVNRPVVKGIWKKIERWIFPRLKNVYTVNESIAGLYEDEYRVRVGVVRNVPEVMPISSQPKNVSRKQLDLPEDKFIIILQGNGINIQRGAEEAVEAMKNVNALLLIAGNGDVIEQLKSMVKEFGLTEKVIFKSRMPYHQLVQYTQCADLGLTLDKNTNINYRYSLPNKLFDYIQCRVPILASELVEVKKVIDGYVIGTCISKVTPEEISTRINQIMNNPNLLRQWHINLDKAASELNWEREKHILLQIVRNAIARN